MLKISSPLSRNIASALALAVACLLQFQPAQARVCLDRNAEDQFQVSEWIAEVKVLQTRQPKSKLLRSEGIPNYYSGTSFSDVKIERIYKNISAIQNAASKTASPYKDFDSNNVPLKVGQVRTIILSSHVAEFAQNNNIIVFIQKDNAHNEDCSKAFYGLDETIVTSKVGGGYEVRSNVVQFLQNKVK